MASITGRNVPDEVHRAIRVRAARHGRSAEAEIREILASAVKPQGRLKLDSLLAEIGRKAKLTDDEFAIFESVGDESPARVIEWRRATAGNALTVRNHRGRVALRCGTADRGQAPGLPSRDLEKRALAWQSSPRPTREPHHARQLRNAGVRYLDLERRLERKLQRHTDPLRSPYTPNGIDVGGPRRMQAEFDRTHA